MLKTARIDARVNVDIHKTIRKAADIEGLTLTSFITKELKKAADRVIENHSLMKLAQRDQLLFVEKLLNQQPATTTMMETLKLHEQRVIE